MAAEYAARMEVLQRRREELTAQRQAVEKRMALREATAAEFSAVALQSYKHKWKAQRSAAIAAKKRNDEFIRSLQETQRQVHENWSRLQSDQSSSSALLAQEKARYNRRVGQIYPAWQEQLQRQRVQKLRELEDKKRAVERRRYLAKKSFEKEQTLGDLIRKTRHEVEMAENLEQNELYERELLRTQSTNQAKEVDQSIREVAQEARSYLQQQAAKHLEVMPELGEELAERLSETFSPRNTLRALREGSSSLAFEENQQCGDEEKPARQIRVEIPARSNNSARSYYPDVNQRHPNQAYRSEEVFDDDFVDEIPREFTERPAFFNSAVAERRATEIRVAEDECATRFEQDTEYGQAPLASWSQRQRSGVEMKSGKPEATFSQPTYRDISQTHIQQPSSGNDRSEIRQEMIREPVGNVAVLPTLVTGKLDPIPEVNEQISLHGVSSKTSEIVSARTTTTEDEHKTSITEVVSSVPSVIAAESSASLQSLPSSTPPLKIEENRVASVPAVTIAIQSPVDNLPNKSLEANCVDEENHATESASEPVINDVKPEEGLLIATLEQSEHISPVQTMRDGIPEFTTKPSMQQSQDVVAGKDESGIATPHDETSILDDRDIDSLSVEGNNIPTHFAANNRITAVNDWESEHPLEVQGINTESSATMETVEDVSPVSMKNYSIDEREIDQSPSFKSSTDSSHVVDTTTGTGLNDASPSIVASYSLEVAEAFIREPEDRFTEEVPAEAAEVSPAAVPHTTDLLEPLSPPTTYQAAEDDMLLTSMQSDDFDLSANSVQPSAKMSSIPSINDEFEEAKMNPAVVNDPPSPAIEEVNTASITEKLSSVDRVKALGALISRVEEGATEGDTLGGSVGTGSSNDSTKRELLKMAVGGRKAQIAFYGSDICFELIVDISKDLGPVLFPPKAFEGIMNDQKLRKLHQSNKEKQLDLWKVLSGYLKQLVQLKAIPASTLVDLFVTTFLAHDPDNKRSQRKLREFLVSVCGGGSGSRTPSPRKEASTTSPPPSPPKQEVSPEAPKPTGIGTPALLQTAFLQRQSPPKPKVFRIASSSFKDRSSGSSDVLASMSSGPMKLSQKLMRGGKMNDYSEFEEEEEVDLQNLIGTKSAFSSGSSSLSRSTYQTANRTPAVHSSAKEPAVEEEDDEFDADF